MLNEELTKEEIDQSIQILTEINKDHPEMLGGGRTLIFKDRNQSLFFHLLPNA